MGDITTIDITKIPKPVFLLIGGSPCQDLSLAKKNRKGLDGDRSSLFFDYIRFKKELNPRYFILENVASMSSNDKNTISKIIGCEPILINSALVSAQSRKRLYWTNIPNVTQPEDKHIYLKDVLEDKSNQIGAFRGRYIVNGKRQDYKHKCAGLTTQRIELRYDNKSNCLTTVGKDNIAIVGKNYRKLTQIEYERLQTVPDNYTKIAPKTQRYKMLGNGFTVPVIKHILSFIPCED